MAEQNKKVFISYSWDSEEHKNWVLKLATDLRSHGVDVIFDQWDARLGKDLPFFLLRIQNRDDITPLRHIGKDVF